MNHLTFCLLLVASIWSIVRSLQLWWRADHIGKAIGLTCAGHTVTFALLLAAGGLDELECYRDAIMIVLVFSLVVPPEIADRQRRAHKRALAQSCSRLQKTGELIRNMKSNECTVYQ